MHDFDAITARLADEKQGLRVLEKDGARLAVVERGARVMGFASAGGGVPADTLSVRDDDDGQLTGGDRLWLAPEVAWFWPSLEKAREDPIRHALSPAAIDPGAYGQGDAGVDRVELHARMELEDHRDQKKIQLQLTRGVRLLPLPDGVPGGLEAVAFATDHRLEAVGGDAGAVAGCWSIAQVTPGGTLVCPVTRELDVPTDVRTYYDPFGDVHVTAGADAVRFRIDAGRRIKMGLRPEHSTGRMGYLRPLADGRSVLITRFFASLPGEHYVDVPRSADAGVRSGGCVLQAYNDDLTFGPFGEMEHHDPAVEVGGVQSRSSTATTLVVAGPEADVRSYGSALLGAQL